MTTLTKIIISIITSFLLASCNFIGVKGSGNVIKEERPLESFNSVQVRYGLQVTLKQDVNEAAIVETDDNLQDVIITRVNNDVLHIETKKNIMKSTQKNITVHYNSLSGLKATSGSQVTSNNTIISDSFKLACSSGANANIALESNDVALKVSSGGTVNLKGNTAILKVKVSSGGNLNATSFAAKTVQAKASSGGNLSIYAKESLKADASSGGNISYIGNPKQLDIMDNRSGSVNKS